MDERHPKRRKDKYNPYTLTIENGRYYLTFQDGQRVHHKMEIDVNLYKLFDRFELEDIAYLNERDRHLDQTELSEALLSRYVHTEQEALENSIPPAVNYSLQITLPAPAALKRTSISAQCAIVP